MLRRFVAVVPRYSHRSLHIPSDSELLASLRSGKAPTTAIDTSNEADDYGLEDFQHYHPPASDVTALTNKLTSALAELKQEREELRELKERLEELYDKLLTDGKITRKERKTENKAASVKPPAVVIPTKPFPQQEIESERPAIVVSELHDPFLNLALEDYVYHQMPESSKRLMFYTNSPCVVIGKNQNPWKEVNLPVLNSLGVPLVRRNSGGGTVVHDHGNINFSFMTSKSEFDRFYFAQLVVNAANRVYARGVKVNDRGDIVTNDGYKVSGSAYKISKGRSYHHGTMLLSSRLDVLGKLLHRTPELGKVTCQSIDSVKSSVTNTEIDPEVFIEEVSLQFEREFGKVEPVSEEMQEALDQNEMLGLGAFVEAERKSAPTLSINESIILPKAVVERAQELKEWAWRYGHTPKFTHEFVNTQLGFTLQFEVAKGAIVTGMTLEVTNPSIMPAKQITEAFEILQAQIDSGELKYTGSTMAGFILDDKISDWVGQSIDGTV
ncbi:hypothetical protein DICA1_B11958 [Diutina catenulata]